MRDFWRGSLLGVAFLCGYVLTVRAQYTNTATGIPDNILGITGTPDSSTFLRGDRTWAVPSGGGSIPTGVIVFTMTSCPTGFTEVSGLDGRFVLGTLAASGNVGTTGGSDNITPAGTNSAPTFTGNAFSSVINHTHPVTDPGHTHLTRRYPTATGGNSGFTIDTSMSGILADNTLPTASSTTSVTTNNPAGGVSSITPTGSVTAPTFTGTQFDNRPVFIRMIACSKD